MPQQRGARAQAAVALPVLGFQRPRGADSGGALVIQVCDTMGTGRRDSQSLPTRVHRLLRHGIKRPSDNPAGEVKRVVGKSSMFPAVQVDHQRRVRAASFTEAMLTGGEDLVVFREAAYFSE